MSCFSASIVRSASVKASEERISSASAVTERIDGGVSAAVGREGRITLMVSATCGSVVSES